MTMTSDMLIKVCESISCDVSKVKVIVYIYENADPKSGIFEGSLDKIAHGADVSLSTAFKVMKAWQQEGMAKQVGRGCWRVEDGAFGEFGDEDLCVMVRNYSRVVG